jgi:uncharacterized protein (DUF1501 family)
VEVGSLAIVHAAGSPDPSRSHFDAQDFLDAGTPGVKSTRDGWLNRALQSRPRPAQRRSAPSRSSRTSRAPSPAAPRPSRWGRSGTSACAAGGPAPRWRTASRATTPRRRDAALRTTGSEAFEALRALRDANPARFAPAPGADYPAAPIGQRLKQIAQLIKADVGLEIAATDCGGWDTHAGQGASRGPLAARLGELGDALAAFSADLCERMADVCIVTMTEFGRTVKENGTRGTDHGHGSVMLVLGGGVKGRRVLARWKGLREQDLYEGRDLAVTTDHREVLSEVLAEHLGVTGPRGECSPALLRPARAPRRCFRDFF